VQGLTSFRLQACNNLQKTTGVGGAPLVLSLRSFSFTPPLLSLPPYFKSFSSSPGVTLSSMTEQITFQPHARPQEPSPSASLPVQNPRPCSPKTITDHRRPGRKSPLPGSPSRPHNLLHPGKKTTAPPGGPLWRYLPFKQQPAPASSFPHRKYGLPMSTVPRQLSSVRARGRISDLTSDKIELMGGAPCQLAFEQLRSASTPKGFLFDPRAKKSPKKTAEKKPKKRCRFLPSRITASLLHQKGRRRPRRSRPHSHAPLSNVHPHGLFPVRVQDKAFRR